MRSLNLDQLRTFLAVAETTSFSEAGRRLNLTQSAVSQQIKELESRMGVRLLDRLGKKAHPTVAGADLRRHAIHLLHESEVLVEAMRAHRDRGWGRVRLATSATLAAYILPPILLRLRKQYPHLEVSVTAGPTREVLLRVLSNEADLAFVNGPVPSTEPALAVSVVCESSLVAFWPRAFGPAPPVVKPEHLTDKPFIFYTAGNLNRELVQNWFQRDGCTPATAMEIDIGLSIALLVAAGLGVSILPSEARKAAEASKKVMVRPLQPSIPSQLYVAIHKDKPRITSLRVVHDALVATRI